MSTFNDLIEDAQAILRGYVMAQDQSTYLTAGVDSDDLTWSVADASRLSPGRAECGSELVYIDTFDTQNNQITIAPYGRGVDGSTAASHSSNAQVINNPRFPRHRIKQAINATINQVGSIGLFAVGTSTITTVADDWSYELPAATTRVIDVQYEHADDKWIQLRQWKYDPSIATTTHATGKALVTGLLPGDRTLVVTYAKDPSELSADADVFATVTGLPESCRDVIVFGACWRMLSAVGPGMLDALAISAADLDTRKVQGQEEANVSLQMYRSFTQRFNEERAALLDRYQTPIHVTRF